MTILDRLASWYLRRRGWVVVDEGHLTDLEDRNRRMERALGIMDRMGTDRCMRLA